MGGNPEKKHSLRRVGAWCARIIARVSKHSHVNKKHSDHADDGSPETENESWVTTTQRTNRFSSRDDYDDGASITETDRAPSVLYPVRRRATTASSRSNRSSSRRNRASQHQDNNSNIADGSIVYSEPSESSRGSLGGRASTRDELSLIASQRLHVAGLYARAQHLKRKKLRELSYEKSLQKPLSHIQVRRRLCREKEEIAAGPVITPAFVCIRKAELGRDVRRRLQICGFNADDSVPPWLPSAASAGRWSCELAVGSPRSAASAAIVLDQKLRLASQTDAVSSQCTS
ncbi:hypothetical protein Gpo141_00011406 [Globisporangium polare]